MNEDKFNHLADIYEKYRPSYPENYIKDVITKNFLINSLLIFFIHQTILTYIIIFVN